MEASEVSGGRKEEGRGAEMSSTTSSRICQLLMIHMTGGAPFGFRIASKQADGCSPFLVSMIRMNGKAYRAGLLESDLVLAINGFSCYNAVSHQSATKLMEYDDPELTLHILRGESIREDDINTSLQALDSQILVLTDQEIQCLASKKQSHYTPPVSKSPHVNGPNLANSSPFRLQPPPQNRAKLVERRKDKQTLPQTNDNEQDDDLAARSISSHTQDGLIAAERDTAGQENISNVPFPGGCFSDQLTTEAANRTANQINENHINKESSGISEQNVAKQHVPPETQEQYFRQSTTANDTSTIADAKPKTVRFEPTPIPVQILTTARNQNENVNGSLTSEEKWSLICQRNAQNQQTHNEQQQQKQQPKEDTPSSTRQTMSSRYRVEQKIEFKTSSQSRQYDAESGQFKENGTAMPPKRRSNSISSYHMYMSPIGMRPPLIPQQSAESQNWQQNGFSRGIQDARPTSFSNTMPLAGSLHGNSDVRPTATFSNTIQDGLAQGPTVSTYTHSHSSAVKQTVYSPMQASNTVLPNTSYNSSGPLTVQTTDNTNDTSWSSEKPQVSKTPGGAWTPSQWDSSVQQSPSIHQFSPGFTNTLQKQTTEIPQYAPSVPPLGGPLSPPTNTGWRQGRSQSNQSRSSTPHSSPSMPGINSPSSASSGWQRGRSPSNQAYPTTPQGFPSSAGVHSPSSGSGWQQGRSQSNQYRPSTPQDNRSTQGVGTSFPTSGLYHGRSPSNLAHRSAPQGYPSVPGVQSPSSTSGWNQSRSQSNQAHPSTPQGYPSAPGVQSPSSTSGWNQGRLQSSPGRPSTPSNRPARRLIRLRSTDDESSPGEPFRTSGALQADQDNLLFTTNKTSYPAENPTDNFHRQQRIRPNSASIFNQNRYREPEAPSQRACQYASDDEHQTGRRFLPRGPFGPQPNPFENIAQNEGRGGRLFARRRANSEAWIVGERNDAAPKVITPDVVTTSGNRSNETTNSTVPRRRRSLLGGHNEQPVVDPSNNMQYKSATAQRLFNSFPVAAFDTADPQHSRNSSYSYSNQASFGQPMKLHQPNSWQTGETAVHRSSHLPANQGLENYHGNETGDFSSRHRFAQMEPHRRIDYTDL